MAKRSSFWTSRGNEKMRRKGKKSRFWKEISFWVKPKGSKKRRKITFYARG